MHELVANLCAPYGRLLADVAPLPGHKPGSVARVDMMGKFVMRYTDDRGETWSSEQYLVPYRLTSIDYKNEWHGNVTVR